MMAIPKNQGLISTNLPISRFEAFLSALKEEKVQWVPGSTSLFAESAGCEYDFDGARYSISEFVEEVNSVYLVSAEPQFLETLINELEDELAVVVKERDYDKAKIVNGKIKDLTKLKARENVSISTK